MYKMVGNKYIINTYYPIYWNTFFPLYDGYIAKDITLDGQNFLLELDSKIKTFKA